MLSLRRKRSEISLMNNADRAFEAGQWRRAADLYRRVLDRNPDNLSIWMKYGHSRKEMGDFGEAESAYRAAAARHTSSPEPLFRAACSSSTSRSKPGAKLSLQMR